MEMGKTKALTICKKKKTETKEGNAAF